MSGPFGQYLAGSSLWSAAALETAGGVDLVSGEDGLVVEDDDAEAVSDDGDACSCPCSSDGEQVVVAQ